MSSIPHETELVPVRRVFRIRVYAALVCALAATLLVVVRDQRGERTRARSGPVPAILVENPGREAGVSFADTGEEPALVEEIAAEEIAAAGKPSAIRILVKEGRAEIAPSLCCRGGRLVIGVPGSGMEKIEVRLEPIHNGNEDEQSRVSIGSRVSATRTGLRSSTYRTCNGPSGDVLRKERSERGTTKGLTLERSFRFPHPGSFGGGRTEDPSRGGEGVELIESRLLAEGSRSAVYVDRRDLHLPHLRDLGKEIVRLIDRELLELIESRIWPIEDIDRNGRFTLLLTSEMVHISPAQQLATVPLKGMTWSEDYSPVGAIGNNSDVVYLHSHLQNDSGLKSLLLHEMSHAACFSRAFRAEGCAGRIPPDWINEGIAHLAETWKNSDRSNWETRLQAFELDPQHSPLMVEAYSRVGLWRHPGSRGAVISFFHWLSRGRSENFVREWLSGNSPDAAGLEAALGKDLDELFQDWSIDTARGWSMSSGLVKGLELERQKLMLQTSTFAVYEVSARSRGILVQFPSEARGQVAWLPAATGNE